MRQLTTDVLVIGGGATGTGVLRDLALRGIRAVLVEKGDLTHGTTGRYHGLLHSGGRYVVKDQASARECAEENEILRRIMPHCLEDTGGFFVLTPADDESYVERFLKGCAETGVAVHEITMREALRREPLLNPRISRVFEVRDGAADSFLATHANAEDARRHGAQVLTYHNVTALEGTGQIVGAVCEDLRTGEEVHIHASYVVNAAGAWAGKIAGLAGVKVTVVPGKGTMVALNHRLLDTVVNRCKPPADGDIIVPIRTVAVIGTTDVSVPDPDVYGITPEEVALMLEEGEQLVPGISRVRVLRAWAGVRPLYKDQDVASDRDISRTYKLLDHEARDGVTGLISIVGGKWTTYRRMAQEASDAVAEKLGVSVPCRTHLEPLPGARGQGTGDRGQGSGDHHPPASPRRRGDRGGRGDKETRRQGDREQGMLDSQSPIPNPQSPASHPSPPPALRLSPIPHPPSPIPYFWKGQPLAQVESDDSYGDLICECELVTRDRVIRAISEGGAANIDDVRRDTRLGMGPCQGGFCTYRAVALWDEVRGQGSGVRGQGSEFLAPTPLPPPARGGTDAPLPPPARGGTEGGRVPPPAGGGTEGGRVPPPAGGGTEGGSTWVSAALSPQSSVLSPQSSADLAASGALLRHFLQERWKGLTAILWGDQLRQARLDEIIYLDTLGVDLLPHPAPDAQQPSDGLVTDHPAIATEYH